jgi:hypothetical protein
MPNLSFRIASNAILLLLALMAGAGLAFGADSGFAFQDKPGQFLDVLLGDRIVARYMYAFDKSDPKRLHETYKPYLHVFDAEGKAPITKGPGGQFTHHRGIFVGWNQTGFDGKRYDLWHMPKSQQVHQKFLQQEAKADHATLTSLVFWNDSEGQPIIEEERTMIFRALPAPGIVAVDLATRLKAARGDVRLDGDPEHAGAQYRPANEVVAAETTYLFPKEKASPTKDRDYPWVGETYALAGKRYSVVDLNHPENPKDTVFSAYRDYGRFGAFFKKDIKAGETLALKYRFLISAGELPDVAAIQKAWDEFAGVASPSPVPKTTVTGGANKGGKKPAAKAK